MQEHIDIIYGFWVGFILPNLVSVINRPYWQPWQKGISVIATSLVAGTVTAWATGNLTGLGWSETVAVVIASAITSYKLLWQPTGIGPKIELATSGATGTDVKK